MLKRYDIKVHVHYNWCSFEYSSTWICWQVATEVIMWLVRKESVFINPDHSMWPQAYLHLSIFFWECHWVFLNSFMYFYIYFLIWQHMAFFGRFVFKPNGEGLLYYDIIIPAVSISVLATIDHSYSLHIHTRAAYTYQILC